MICNLPSQTVLCSRRQARIVMPSLVMEFIGTIWQSAPHQRGDRVDHHSISVFGVLHFVERLLGFCLVWYCSEEPAIPFPNGFRDIIRIRRGPGFFSD